MEISYWSAREFRNLVLKMINNLKEGSKIQPYEIRKSIQDLGWESNTDEKVSNMDEKFSKDIEVLGNRNVVNEKPQ
jgi:hypothetical protein